MPAAADNQQVQVQDNVFLLPGVAVKPGESVTWSYPGGGDRHNVNFEDGLLTSPAAPSPNPWNAMRTFPTEGTFRYYCQEHGGPGGGGMSGLVYVNAAGAVPGIAPTASFTVSPGAARVGQSVAFKATGTTDPDGPIIRHEWDLDGNGFYETDTGALPTISQVYDTAGGRTVKLRVTDSQGHINETTRQLSVSSPPTASFTVSPSTALTGQTVAFNGSASADTDGTIAKYEWDLDGDGSYETDTGATPTTSRSYTTAGSRTVGLRVTDNAGLTAETTRSVEVNAPAPARPPVTTPVQPVIPTPTTPAPPDCSSLSGAKRTACVQKTCASLKGTKRARCIQKSCRYVKGASRAKCVLKSCRYLKGKARSACRLKSCRSLKGSKKKACVRKYRRRS